MAATAYHAETLTVEQAKARLRQLRARNTGKPAANGSPVYYSGQARSYIKADDVASGVKLSYYRSCPCSG